MVTTSPALEAKPTIVVAGRSWHGAGVAFNVTIKASLGGGRDILTWASGREKHRLYQRR